MTDTEQNLYQMHLQNLYGDGKVMHDNGDISTLYQGVQEHNGQFYNIPTVWSGQIQTEKYTKPDGTTMDVPNAQALQNVEKTGWAAFPSYPSPQEADDRYDAMHKYMDKDTADYNNNLSITYP